MKFLVTLLLVCVLAGCGEPPSRSRTKYTHYTTIVHLVDGSTVEASGTHYIHANGVLRFYDKNKGDSYVSCEIKDSSVAWWKDK